MIFVANVVIPPASAKSSFNREDYVKYALRTHTVCIITSSGEYHASVPVAHSFAGVNDGFLFALDFPENEYTLGSQVLCIKLTDTKDPIVIASIPNKDTLSGLNEEEQFILSKKSPDKENSVIIEGRGLKGILNIIANSEEGNGGAVNIASSNKEGTAEITFNTNYFKIMATEKVEVVSNNIIELIVRNLVEKKEFTSIMYKLLEGLTISDEWGNLIETREDLMRVDSKEIHIGVDSPEWTTKGETTVDWLKDLVGLIRQMVFVTNSGNTLRLINDLAFQEHIAQLGGKLLSTKVKIE